MRRTPHPVGLASACQLVTTSPGCRRHVISRGPARPLRDEGLAYARMLLDAGVSVVSRHDKTAHATPAT